MTDCIFCKIANHEIPSSIVYEDDLVMAFLDLSQVTKGHTLLVPKKHVADIFEYDEELAKEVFSRIPKIARAIERSSDDILGLNILNNNRSIAYQSVFHSHIHFLPRYEDSDSDGFGLKWKTHEGKYSQAELAKVVASIKDSLEE